MGIPQFSNIVRIPSGFLKPERKVVVIDTLLDDLGITAFRMMSLCVAIYRQEDLPNGMTTSVTL